MRLLIISILLVLLLPFAFATTLNQPIGIVNGQFQVSGQCDNANVDVGLQAALGINTVLVSETVANNLRAFTFVFTPPQDGTYTIVVACENENFQQGQACIGAQCVQAPLAANFCGDGVTAGGEECDDGNNNILDACDNQCKLTAGPPPAVVPGPSGGGGGGGGGSGRTGFYNECSDFKDNDNDTLIDYPDDLGCIDGIDDTEKSEDCRSSWVCTEWGDCRNNFQVRTCTDNNNCETPQFKPIEQQSCGAAQVQPPQVPRQPPMITPPVAEESFLSKYSAFIWGGLLLLVLLVALILAILYFINRKKVAYNITELKQWIAKEKSAGTSKEDIKNILAEKTGWSEEELVNVFKELNGGNSKK